MLLCIKPKLTAKGNLKFQEYYNAFYKGNQIIGSEDGGWSVCPMDDSRIAFYAMNDRILSYKLPEGQTADTIFAKALMSDNQVAYRAVNRKGQITANK